jgi:hypothetical protein
MNLRWKLTIVLVLAAVAALLVSFHVHGMNGPWYWMWAWRRLGWGIYPLMLAAATPAALAQWLFARGKVRPARLVWLLMLATLLMQFAALSRQPPGIVRLRLIVENSINTSYYNAAVVLCKQMDQGMSYRDWLEIYPQLMDKMMLHAGYKPPGLLFYYIALIRLFGYSGASAWAGGIGIALLACGSVAATYAFIRRFGGDESAAFLGASYFALCPSLILFLPQFDQAYPILSCLMLITWAAALERRWISIAFGGLLALAIFLSPTFLMFGMFLAVYTLLYIRDGGSPAFVRALERSALAIATVILLYFLFYAVSGFNPIQTFLVANQRSQAHLISLQRPWPMHSLFDLVDIALGLGWIAVPLIVWGTRAACAQGGSKICRLTWLGIMQVLVAVAVAVIPGENARIFLPMMPLLMPPVGLELSRWNARARCIAFACLWLNLVVLAQNMTFIYMGMELDGPRLPSQSAQQSGPHR